MRAALRDLANPAFLTEVVEQLQDELVKRFPLDVGGQVRPFPPATGCNTITEDNTMSRAFALSSMDMRKSLALRSRHKQGAA